MAFKGCVGDYWITYGGFTDLLTFYVFFLRSSGSVAIDTLQIFEAILLTTPSEMWPCDMFDNHKHLDI